MNSEATIATNPRPNAGDGDKVKSIVLYSPDVDFCVSLTLLFQDRYNVTMTTDVTMLSDVVRACMPDLVIADASPTEHMQLRFGTMKRENHNLRILVLYVSGIGERKVQQSIRSTVDAVIHKPADLKEIIYRIDELLAPSYGLVE